MVGRLIALHLPPDRFPHHLREVWEGGDAALPLPLDAPKRLLREMLDRIRPHELVTSDPEPGESSPTTRLTTPGPPHPIPDGTALVVSTSGSTGEPKGVVLSHRALEASTTASVERLGARHGDRFTLALPLHHVAGLQVLLRAWACGTEARIVPDPGDAKQLVPQPADDPTEPEHISLVPTQLQRLVELGELPAGALRRWRTVLVGGAQLDPGLLARAEAAGATVVTSYGMTETCGGCVYDGEPLRDVEVEVRDDGRVRLRGPMLFSGYLTAVDPSAAEPAVTDAPTPQVHLSGLDPDGWFTTGDLGELHDGRLRVLGRHDDVIISGGENVPAQVITEALLQHPSLLDVAVIGVQDDQWGQRVVAVAVARDPTSPPALAELREHVADRFPVSYAPRQLVLTEQLPRDGLGKPTAAALLQLVADAG